MITLKNISKTYKNGELEVQALQPLNLKVEQGEFVAIMGSSGSGKSTLMNIIGCLDVPSSGEYVLDGEEVHTLDEEQLARVRNRKIGFVFQSFNLLGRQTVLQNVTLPMMYAGIGREQRNERALELLKKVGLEGRVKHRPTELSGGQRQRVAIARALTMNAPILLADEPTGNLDTKSSHEIMQLFKEIHQEGTTIVLVTHEPDIAEHADRILLFGDGQMLKDTRKGSVVT
ncbi:ABC transporter ATP-binding protein [Paenibacillus woosongensis]|uniref:ABC transporter ATP-binding protein n=1 Tax=Paenibacillus woosongensis TaxID=307580 RepID=A0A7X3CP61_9BACL|nr:ABC transporter ATP-binding protein [Paenibacillus woosongensis]MUG46529.1 ATP-binding cassette domain-containing protein [Paenibacillus woosongensis]WHX49850.1 ABC transporter ATP-binding protein [Paenibacillus woosongensis]GIP61005.1 macrolide ABC transporter ATP-binding protein [Paenibacillus woosongensis]